MSCTGFIEPLNLQCLFVNMFAGSMDIFSFIMALIISLLAARFRMPGYIFLTSILLYGVIMSNYISNEIYILLILISGVVSFTLLSKVWRRE